MKLRPMSEAPKDGRYVVYLVWRGGIPHVYTARFYEGTWRTVADCGEFPFKAESANAGWLPIPYPEEDDNNE